MRKYIKTDYNNNSMYDKDDNIRYNNNKNNNKNNNTNTNNNNNNNNKSILIENKDSKNQLVNNKNNYDTLENNISLSLIDIKSKREPNLQKFGFDVKGRKSYDFNDPCLSFVKINKKKKNN